MTISKLLVKKAIILASVISLLLLSGCASQSGLLKNSFPKILHPFKEIEPNSINEFYDKKLIGKITIWTDEDFYNRSSLAGYKIYFNRGIYIDFNQIKNATTRTPVAEMGMKNKYTIIAPAGKINIRTSYGTEYSKFMDFNVVGGEERFLYWKEVGGELVEKSYQQNNKFDTFATISRNTKEEYKTQFSPQIIVNNISTTDSEVDLQIKTNGPLVQLTVNSQNIKYKNGDIFIHQETLNYGTNTFQISALNSNGFDTNILYKVIRLTEAEKRQKEAEELAVKQKIAEAERLEKIRIANEQRAKKAEEERIAREGDGSSDDLLCKKYGLKPLTNGYAECRMRLDFAQKESIAAQERYAQEKAAYDRQVEAIKKERERQIGMRQLELGLRMMGGQSPIDALGSLGTNAPIAPRAPSPINQSITMPNGRIVNCTTIGSNTNCF